MSEKVENKKRGVTSSFLTFLYLMNIMKVLKMCLRT